MSMADRARATCQMGMGMGMGLDVGEQLVKLLLSGVEGLASGVWCPRYRCGHVM